MNTFCRVLWILTLFFVISAQPVQADDSSEAHRRYEEGRLALEAGRYREAALHFEAAGSIRKHGAAPYAAAMAWEKAEEPSRAADNFHLAIQLPGLDAAAKDEAKKRLELLEQSLGTVVVQGPEQIIVQFEGSMEATPPARLHASPGISSLLVARDEKIERRDLKLAAGELMELDVTNPLDETKPAPPPPTPTTVVQSNPTPKPKEENLKVDSEDTQTRKVIGYSALGAGALSTGFAIALGLKTMSARDDFEADPTQRTYDKAKSLRTWTNVAWASAAVLGGVGAALVFWPTDEEDSKGRERAGVSLSPTPNGVVLRGSF